MNKNGDIINIANEIRAQITITACPGIFYLVALFILLSFNAIQESFIELVVRFIDYRQFGSIVECLAGAFKELTPTSFAYITLIFVWCILRLSTLITRYIINKHLATFSYEASTTASTLNHA